MFEPNHRGPFSRREIAEHMVGRRLDAKRILARLKVLPLVKARQLIDARDDLKAEVQPIVNDRYGRFTRAVGGQLVLHTCSRNLSRGAEAVR